MFVGLGIFVDSMMNIFFFGELIGKKNIGIINSLLVWGFFCFVLFCFLSF